MSFILQHWQTILWILGAYFIGILSPILFFGPRIERNAVGIKVIKNKEDPEMIDKVELFFDEDLLDKDMKNTLKEEENDDNE